MDIYNSTENLIFDRKVSVALGTFDGVHLGHKRVIESCVNSGLYPVVFAINRPFLGVEHSQPKLSTDTVKAKLIRDLGIKALCEISFEEVYSLSPEEFFTEILIKKLNVGHISCGFNFQFGKNASGDVCTLKELCNLHNISFSIEDAILYNGTPISSSRIRKAIEEGYTDAATDMLGHLFTYDFEVVDGDKLGRKLGSPTINQYFPEEFVCPRFGVYAAVAEVAGKRLPAVCNVGTRPTVNGNKPRSETFIIDFSGDLYGQNIPVSPVKFLRPEIKFEGLEQLKTAIFNDATVAKKVISERNVL